MTASAEDERVSLLDGAGRPFTVSRQILRDTRIEHLVDKSLPVPRYADDDDNDGIGDRGGNNMVTKSTKDELLALRKQVSDLRNQRGMPSEAPPALVEPEYNISFSHNRTDMNAGPNALYKPPASEESIPDFIIDKHEGSITANPAKRSIP